MPDDNFEKECLLICEGVGDKRFFQKLFLSRGIGGDIEVKSVNENIDGQSGGRGNMGNYLKAVQENENFIENVKIIIIVSDNDEDVNASFLEVQKQLRIADLPVPENVQELVHRRNKKSVAVLMVPPGQIGNLESMCLPAAISKWGLQEELDEWVAATPASTWPLGKQAKVKIQALISAHHKRLPETGFAAHWRSDEQLCTPLNHATFNDVVSFLERVPEMLGR
ncbi:MAG: hypothetical protein KDJ69_12470 [Nitratireductor sp.]|nr:hypothetical protein [Nitratireductor sp.]